MQKTVEANKEHLMDSEVFDRNVAMLEQLLTELRNETRAFDPLAFAWYLRRARDATLIAPVFGEPAWDILLDLYMAELNGKTLQTSAIAMTAGVPMTTALRHIAVLEERGWVERIADKHDKRRTNVRLSEQGRQLLAEVGRRAMNNTPAPLKVVPSTARSQDKAA
jgi:MarR family transcriptional regulator, temperature-dependent positive regulator of motility